jgi:tetratricopeptide (TPR) repeat protein
MVVWGLAELASRYSRLRMPVCIAAGLVLATWTVLTFIQVATWKTSATVFQHAIDVTSDNYFAYNHLGLAYAQPGATKEEHDLVPREFEAAVYFGPSYDAANSNLGGYYLNTKEYRKALESFQKGARVNPHGAFHRANVGSAYMALGEFDNAAGAFSEAIEIEPENAAYHYHLATALSRQGKVRSAIDEWQEVLRLNPNEVAALNDLAWCLATNPDASIRDGKKALELAQRGARITDGKYLVILNTLAAAYAETGRFDKAVDTETEAMKMATLLKNEFWINVTNHAIRVYQSGSPLRESPMPATPPPEASTPSS